MPSVSGLEFLLDVLSALGFSSVSIACLLELLFDLEGIRSVHIEVRSLVPFVIIG